MSLTRRGFMGALLGVALGAKLIVRGEPTANVELFGLGNRARQAIVLSEVQPYSIPAFINEYQGGTYDRPGLIEALDRAWEEIPRWEWEGEWPPNRVRRGPRYRMSKADRDHGLYSKEQRRMRAGQAKYTGPHVPLSDFIAYIDSTGARLWRSMAMRERDDEAKERRERLWRSLWAVPDGRKFLA